jgi:flagellar basal-body rod protein FlgC
MNLFTSLDISSSAMSAERIRMNLISSNLANANSTRTAEGGPYKRKDAIFTATPLAGSFTSAMSKADRGLARVDVTGVVEDSTPPRMQYDPTHPDADGTGYVALPNVNIIEEMADMISATRIYEANITAAQAAKSMALKALELGR